MATKKKETESVPIQRLTCATEGCTLPFNHEGACDKPQTRNVTMRAPDVLGAEPAPVDPNTKMEGLWASLQSAESNTELLKMKMMVLGKSGSGKTSLGAKFGLPGRVLHVYSEAQAMPTIQQWNPKSLPFRIQNMQDVAKFFTLISDPRLAERIDALVVDSLTDVQRIIKAFYMSKQKIVLEEKGETKGKDTASMKTWGLIIDATSRFARVVRDLPVHVLVICLDEVEDGVHQPSLYGKKLPGELGQFFNACGFLSKQEHNGRVRYEVMFEGSDRFPVKTMQGLDAVEAPEPLWWIHKRFGGPLPADVAKRVADWKALGPEEVAVPQQLAEEPAKEEVEGKQQEDKVDEDDPFNSK